ncbi:MAG TPA: hypothetical protein VHG91_00205 [Longimicrobium sp.]|nr:hypothetical protein [Longimicrobium sp.]
MRARTPLLAAAAVLAAALAACEAAPTAPAPASAPALTSVESDSTGGQSSGYLGSGNNTTPPGGS